MEIVTRERDWDCYKNDDGREVFPDELPVETGRGIVADHEFDVGQEAIDAVDPSDDHRFDHAQDQRREGGRVLVDQLQHVHSSLRAHDQPQQTHHQRRSHQHIPASFHSIVVIVTEFNPL